MINRMITEFKLDVNFKDSQWHVQCSEHGIGIRNKSLDKAFSKFAEIFIEQMKLNKAKSIAKEARRLSKRQQELWNQWQYVDDACGCHDSEHEGVCFPAFKSFHQCNPSICPLATNSLKEIRAMEPKRNKLKGEAGRCLTTSDIIKKSL